MKTRVAHLGLLLSCCLALTFASKAHAQNLSVKPITMKAKLHSAEITHNVVRNSEKGVLVKVKLEFSGNLIDRGDVLCLILDKNKVPMTSRFAKQVMAADPEQFPTGNPAELFTVFKKKSPLLTTIPDIAKEFGPRSVLDGPYSDELGRFCGKAMILALKDGTQTSNLEFFLPLSQFPISQKGSYDMIVRLEVAQHGWILDSAEPFNFTLTIK